MPRSHTSLEFGGSPPEIESDIAEAWERAQDPLPEGIELHLERDPGLARAWGSLRLLDGTLVERLSASTVVAIACGDAVVRPTGAMPV